MTDAALQIVTLTGFTADPWPAEGVILDLPAFLTGQDLPIEPPVAVRLTAEANPADLEPWFGKLAMVVVPFGKSADGRGFSLARRLRQLGYTGTIRAEGHILVDQFRAALRVGIDQIAIPAAQAARNPEGQWLAVAHGQGYQARLAAGHGADLIAAE